MIPLPRTTCLENYSYLYHEIATIVSGHVDPTLCNSRYIYYPWVCSYEARSTMGLLACAEPMDEYLTHLLPRCSWQFSRQLRISLCCRSSFLST